MVDIFKEAKEKVMPEWAKFINAGDAYQGTYVGKIVGQVDGYGNEQIIYQLLQEDGSVINVGFGLNKKVLNGDMQSVKFGQIVGFMYKGTIAVKDKFGKPVNVKDFALHQDPKIVDEKWLAENVGHMPQVTTAVEKSAPAADSASLDNFVKDLKSDDGDVPFSSEGSLTVEDKLAAIVKLAVEKLGTTEDLALVKEKVMTEFSIAFIPVNYDKILEKLAAKGF